MDRLSDEMLLEVFSWLEDGITLLDGVSLVCRRWCALARDPRAWRSVRVECGNHLMYYIPHGNPALKEKASMDIARILLHAPAIHHFGWGDVEGFRRHYRPLAIGLSAVRRCRAVIREVNLYCVADLGKSAWAVLRGLLWRNRDHIIDLVIELCTAGTECHEEADEEDGCPASVLRVLARLRRLERLYLRSRWGVPKYAGELQVAGELLPALRYLICDLQKMYNNYEMILDLVRGTAARLHRLHVYEHEPSLLWADLPPTLGESLSRCVQLRELSCTLMRVGCVTNMPHLRRLDLELFNQEVRPEDVDERVRLLAQHNGCLAGLAYLSLTVSWERKEQMCEAARLAVASLLRAVASAARNLTHASINLDKDFEGLVADLLGCWPRLETVNIFWYNKAHVKALGALPNLRLITGRAREGGLLSASYIRTCMHVCLPGVKLKLYSD